MHTKQVKDPQKVTEPNENRNFLEKVHIFTIHQKKKIYIKRRLNPIDILILEQRRRAYALSFSSLLNLQEFITNVKKLAQKT